MTGEVEARAIDGDEAWLAEVVTMEQWLLEMVMIDGAKSGTPVHVFLAREAVASTAIEHPEWDLAERRTRRAWYEAHSDPESWPWRDDGQADGAD